MGYDVDSVIVYGVIICSRFDERKNLEPEVTRVIKLLFPGVEIDDDFWGDTVFELKLTNGNKQYQILNMQHGDGEQTFAIALHVERHSIVRSTDPWPRKLTRPSEAEIKQFVDFLCSKGIDTEYGEYQCLEGGA